MRETVKNYYGSVLQGSDDLRTSACTTSSAPSDYLKGLLSNVHEEVRDRYYGCGLVYPASLEGMRVLDLGCGGGRDCYVLAQLVGPSGQVVGIDMTDEQLELARRTIDWHTRRFGFDTANVEFHKGYIEKLDETGLEPASFDLIVSNCVINLAIDKPAVLDGAHTLLREGGEMYFSDIYASRRIPEELAVDPVLYGECLSGAMYWNDFEHLAQTIGFRDPRLVEDSVLTIHDPAIAARIGHIDFHSATYRLFKLEGLEPACEDYGQAVVYNGGLPHHRERFILDKYHSIERGRMFPVCGNTWRMLHDTRFKRYFEFFGSWDTHYGIFEGCGSSIPFDTASPDPVATTPRSCC
ncbi:MAG: methyltransferase domain-containing protein [Proteobacteria bacterium]|nr:methyltransferase domain-containing protein [Pseudomonadota bacterium]